MRKREHFNREFKLEAVQLLEEGKKPAADLARELKIKRGH
jgi:transposase-like protein